MADLDLLQYAADRGSQLRNVRGSAVDEELYKDLLAVAQDDETRPYPRAEEESVATTAYPPPLPDAEMKSEHKRTRRQSEEKSEYEAILPPEELYGEPLSVVHARQARMAAREAEQPKAEKKREKKLRVSIVPNKEEKKPKTITKDDQIGLLAEETLEQSKEIDRLTRRTEVLDHEIVAERHHFANAAQQMAETSRQQAATLLQLQHNQHAAEAHAFEQLKNAEMEGAINEIKHEANVRMTHLASAAAEALKHKDVEREAELAARRESRDRNVAELKAQHQAAQLELAHEANARMTHLAGMASEAIKQKDAEAAARRASYEHKLAQLKAHHDAAKIEAEKAREAGEKSIYDAATARMTHFATEAAAAFDEEKKARARDQKEAADRIAKAEEEKAALEKKYEALKNNAKEEETEPIEPPRKKRGRPRKDSSLSVSPAPGGPPPPPPPAPTPAAEPMDKKEKLPPKKRQAKASAAEGRQREFIPVDEAEARRRFERIYAMNHPPAEPDEMNQRLPAVTPETVPVIVKKHPPYHAVVAIHHQPVYAHCVDSHYPPPSPPHLCDRRMPRVVTTTTTTSY